jgi:hypothetical protein
VSYLSFQLYQYTDNITGSTVDDVVSLLMIKIEGAESRLTLLKVEISDNTFSDHDGIVDRCAAKKFGITGITRDQFLVVCKNFTGSYDRSVTNRMRLAREIV